MRFKNVEVDDEDEVKPVAGPVTIWIGVLPESTSATTAHNAAQAILALLKKHEITDIDIDFRESIYTRKTGPPLHEPVDELDPLVDVLGPLTPVLGLHIATMARPEAQGTMAIYIAEGGESNRLLGLSCRHVLISLEQPNVPYIHDPDNDTCKDVLLLGSKAVTALVESVEENIEYHHSMAKNWNNRIERFKEMERDTDAVAVEKAEAKRVQTQGFVEAAERETEALEGFLEEIKRDWENPDNRVLGHIVYSPPIAFGVEKHRFTEDWAIFQIDPVKLGKGFQGNKIDLGAF